jgi:NitT/TauT family transport system permease protein
MTQETVQRPAPSEANGAATDQAVGGTPAAARPPWYRTRRGGHALVALVFVAFLGLWAGFAKVFGLSSLVLPTPLAVWGALVEGLASGLLWVHLWVTLQEIVLGFLAGCCLGVGIGTLLAHSEVAQRVLSPYLVASQAMPKLALAPIFVIWFGFGIAPKVVIAALICFFPLLENTVTGLNAVDETKLDLFRMLTASPWQTFIKLRVPNALPVIFAGLRVAIVLSVVGAVVGEYVGANRGLGALIIVTQGNFDTPLMFSVFVVLTVVGTLLYKGMEVLERTLFAWRYLKREE